MKVKRYYGANARTVMKQIRAELGADAYILGNNPAGDGIEILAVSHEDMAGLVDAKRAAPAREAPPVKRQPATASAILSASNHAAAPMASPPRAAMPLRAYVENMSVAEYDDQDGATVPRSRPGETVQKYADAFAILKPAKHSASSALRVMPEEKAAVIPAASGEAANVLAEIKAMKGLLSQQISALAWGDSIRHSPLRGVLLSEMISAGFGAALASAITGKLPDDFSALQARQWLHGVLARNLVCQPGSGIVERGGIFALVGPTGVGKTTTAAKIAAQCVVRHGAKGLGLITTDSYRVGAHDQLRIYGKILGVPVFVAQDATELAHAITAVAGKHLVLIDTIGMGQRDKRMAEQHALLSAPGIERLLLLNATAQTETLDDVVRAYGEHSGAGKIYGAVITKQDEAARLGGVLDVALRHHLRLQFITNGQRVPEDIHPAVAKVLVHQAMKAGHAGAGSAYLIGMAMSAGAPRVAAHG